MSGGYELHQKLRTKAVRQLKKKDYDGAIASLSDGARQLLQDKEQGSGCDLACYLLDVYQQAQTPSTEESRKRVTDLVALAGKDFWRKKVIDAAIRWSVAVTKTPAGDGYLRLAFGEILSKDGDYYAAEPHYIVACSPPPKLASAADLFPPHAPKAFACMMLDWLAAYGKAVIEAHGSGDAATIERLACGSFALRGLLPLLLARALTASRGFLSIYTSRLVQRHANILLPVQPNPKPYTPPPNMAKPPGDAQQLYLTGNAELNFAQMTLAMAATAVEHKKRTQGAHVPDGLRDSWLAAARQFEKELSESDNGDEEGDGGGTSSADYFEQALPELSKIYFDIQPPRGANPNFMQDMLGTLMGGGGAAGGGSASAPAPTPVRTAPPPAMIKPPAVTAAAATDEGEALDLD